MDIRTNEGLIKWLFNLSWLFSAMLVAGIIVSAIIYFVRTSGKKRHNVQVKHWSMKSVLLTASLFLVMAAMCLRLAVGRYLAYNTVEGIQSFGPVEEFFGSLLGTLKIISLDENYADFIIAGKQMTGAVFGENSPLISVYGVYASVLNFLVPLAGGAVLLELISEFFPRVRLFFANAMIWRRKYYFSELNDNSLAFAKSIKRPNVSVIFTDAYTDDEEEKGSEHLSEAKSLGAICLKDDLLQIGIHGVTPKIFLIDREENSNLQTLSALLEKTGGRISKSEIYVFSSDERYSALDEEISFIVRKKVAQWINNLPERKKRSLCKKAEKSVKEKEKKKFENDENFRLKKIRDYYHLEKFPAVIPINVVRNMVVNLFSDVPLFEPLIDRKNEKVKDLNITIIGSGVIGTEAFLTAYWCGQMLDTRLNLTVVSKEKQNKESTFDGEGDFEGRINYINPDIFATGRRRDPILKYSESEYSEPYFSYRYIESDVFSDSFMTLVEEKGLLDTDYFIVALGSDEENFAVADRLREMVGVRHLFENGNRKTVISYAIYNPDLARTMNADNMHRYSGADTSSDVLMFAFGSLEDVYSSRNVFFEALVDEARIIGERYEAKKREPTRKEFKKKKDKRFKDIYSYQSNLSRVYHRKYKFYSAGFCEESVFSLENMEERGFAKEKEAYYNFIFNEKSSEIKTSRLNKLAWLEHRRWCAYMRTKGFRNPENRRGEGFEEYYSLSLPEHETGDHKFTSLKLHPCLVECSDKGIIAASDDFDEFGNLKEGFNFREFTCSNINCKAFSCKYKSEKGITIDRLDCVSRRRHGKNSDSEDFKKWDYPDHDF